MGWNEAEENRDKSSSYNTHQSCNDDDEGDGDGDGFPPNHTISEMGYTCVSAARLSWLILIGAAAIDIKGLLGMEARGLVFILYTRYSRQ